MLRERIIDYQENKADVDKWVRLKGEWRYSEYADYLEFRRIPLTWKNLSCFFRYDKRLMFNLYRYYSMFEEYLRAQYVRDKGDSKEVYEIAQDLYLRDFEMYVPSADLTEIKNLRNDISHAKPLVTNELTEGRVRLLHSYLPKEYRVGFIADIEGCTHKLELDPSLVIVLS